MELKKSIIVGLSITGTIVGVGFASGREIVSFFAFGGAYSILFCLLAGALFGALSYLVFSLSSHGLKKSRFDLFFNFILCVCQLAIASAMIAGIKSLLLSLGVSSLLALIVQLSTCVFSLVFLLIKKDGVYFANSLVSILMFSLVLVLLFTNGMNKIDIIPFNKKLLYLPLLYVGMNIFTAYPLLEEVGRGLNKKERVLSSFFVGLFVFLSLVMVDFLILSSEPGSSDMIMVDIASRGSKFFSGLYIGLLFIGIVSTLLSTIYGAGRFFPAKLGEGCRIALLLTISFAVSLVSFSSIVDKIYPLIGLVCLLTILAKFVLFKTKMSKNEKTNDRTELGKKRKMQ